MRLSVLRVIVCAALAGACAVPLSATDVAVIINGVGLARWEVDREVQKQLPWASFHRSVDDQRMVELESEALDRLILLELKRQWAKERGIAADPTILARELQSVRDRFPTEESYLDALEQRQMSESDLRRAIFRDAVADVVDGRILDTVAQPTPLDVETYFIMHREDYVTPERRRLVHVLVPISPGAPAEAWETAEQESNRLVVAARDGELSLLEEADLRRGTVAPRFRDQIGDLGSLHQGSLLPALDAAAFDPGIGPGTVVGPIRTIYGFSVLEVLEVMPPSPLGLDDVRPAIAAQLRSAWRKTALKDFEEQLLDEAAIQVVGWSDTP